VGKASLIMVVGFNIVFLAMGLNLSGVTAHCYKNYVNYYDMEQAHFIAESITNIALSELYVASVSNTFYQLPNSTLIATNTYQRTINFNGATATVTQFRDLNLLQNTFTVVSTYLQFPDTIIVKSRQQNFAQFAMYTVNDGGIQWTAGELCNGPLHSEGTLVITTSGGSGPIFSGRVTTLGGYTVNGSTPRSLYNGFTGGYANGVTIPLPTSAMMTANMALALPKGLVVTPTSTSNDIYIEFKASDSTMIIKEGAKSTQSDGNWASTTKFTPYGSTTGVYSTKTSSSFDGLVSLAASSNANIHIKGKLNGQITVANVAGTGSIYIDSSVTYKNENVNGPFTSTSPKSDDMLGIVANHSIIITDNTNNNTTSSTGKNPTGNVNIDASIFSLGVNATDGFTAQNYDSRDAGYINLLGGLQQNSRQIVGQTKYGVQYGFNKNYTYDTRYQNSYPPSYPVDQLFGLITYYENMGWKNTNVWSEW
jgi:hypothetical protein